MDSEKLKTLKERFLLCQICEEDAPFRSELRSLPCQHNMCGKCMKEMVKRRRVVCPFCRKEFHLPKTGKFPLFRYAAELAEFLDTQNDQQAKPREFKPKRAEKIQAAFLSELDYCGQKEVGFVLYSNTHPEGSLNEGVYSINILNGNVQSFAHQQSWYSKAIFLDDELYVFNHTKKYIEVYRDELLVRKWCVQGVARCCLMVKHPFRGILFVGITDFNRLFPQHFDSTGHATFCIFNGFIEIIKRFLRITPFGCVHSYKNSIWMHMDDSIWQVPVKEEANYMCYDLPIEKFKIPDRCIRSCSWGEEAIIFDTMFSNSLLVLDLSRVNCKSACTVEAYHPGKLKHTLERANAAVMEEFKISSNPTTGFFYLRRIAASPDNFLAVYENIGSLNVYQLVSNKAEKSTPVQLRINAEPKPGPNYSTFRQKIHRTYLEVKQYIDETYTELAKLIFTFLLIIVILYCFDNSGRIANKMLRALCNNGMLRQASYGWSNLYITVCRYQASTSG
ncbi:hypothetical protein EB796_002244 [Bugula neritina]|uniref:RING-type domain-containing protein n=1 Tax=Bugula neritina TaxID=10212 RepID=A0A7J7KMR8_BUGNE|nr:hypothetical protein EB796_002244 [Bugula neritina]